LRRRIFFKILFLFERLDKEIDKKQQDNNIFPPLKTMANYGFVPGQQAQSKEEQFRGIIQRYEINADYANRLQSLVGFKIVFIFDDSSSMNSQLSDSPLLRTNPNVTRWNELEYFASISIEIANLFNSNGSDVYFLNRPAMKNVLDVGSVLNSFKQMKPNGYTPLTRTLETVLRDNLNLVNYEKKLLIIIVTDGEPTDDSGHGDVHGFKKCLKSRTPVDRIYTSIIACTDQDDSMEYLNKMDRNIKNLDVVDDFRSEKEEILKKSGSRSHQFTYGDYVCKCLLGSVDKSLDRADEKGGKDKDCILS
jgi:hypothetical protein